MGRGSAWVLALCLLVPAGTVRGAERERDYTRDRSKDSLVGETATVEPTDLFDIAATYDQYTESIVLDHLATLPPLRLRLDLAAVEDAYKLLVLSQRWSGPRSTAALHRIVGMKLPTSPRTDKILAEAYLRLGDLYEESTSKRLRLYGLAMQYAQDPMRNLIEGRIRESDGDLFALTFQRGPAADPSRTPGVNDTCDDARHVVMDFSDTVEDVAGGGDHNWFSFDVATGSPNVGQTIHVETASNDNVSFDDTDLTLYGGCDMIAGPGNGVPTGFVAFDDDSGLDFMSLIQHDCVAEGTYYLEVGGFADISAADNFTLSITAVDQGCFVRTADAFEPDNERPDATPIGRPQPAGVPNAILTEVVADEIQAHTIFPTGDNDLVKFRLYENSRMILATARQFPTIFNGFVGEDLSHPAEDSVIELLYDEPKDYGGICNQLICHFAGCKGPLCQISNDGAGCPDPPVGEPIPGFPNCLPWRLFLGNGVIEDWPAENPLATNDDADLAGGNLGSRLEICLPRTDLVNLASSVDTPDFDWYLDVRAFDTQTFEYEVLVHNAGPCRFEQEPNNALSPSPPVPAGTPDGHFDGHSDDESDDDSDSDSDSVPPNQLVLGESMFGINEFSVRMRLNEGTMPSFGTQLDVDVFSFDVESEALLVFETVAPDPGVHDTDLDIFVGPDLVGDFFYTGFSDNDGGPGLLSRIKANFVPACELLDTCGGPWAKGKGKGIANGRVDTDYFIAVSVRNRLPDFPYELKTSISAPGLSEDEPNDACPSEAQAIAVGDTVLGAIGGSCDFDTYGFTLTEDTELSVETVGVDDTTLVLANGACLRLACDDDGGIGLMSRIGGCLPPGDYNLRVRPFNEQLAFNYSLETAGAPCTAGVDDPPTGDELFLCAGDFDDCATIEPPDFVEDPANDLSDCGGTNVASINLGDLVAGAIDTVCDYDAYAFSIAEDSEVLISGAGGDFAMQIADASCTAIACDDDTGSGGTAPYHPQLSGCLAAGDYVVRTRPFSSTVTFAYTVQFGDQGPCDSAVDPPVFGDENFTCTDFDNGQGCAAP